LIETGFLRDQLGQPITDVLQMKYQIFTQSTGGSPVWDSGYMTVSINDGMYTLRLGGPTQPTLDSSIIASSGNYYMGFEVDGDSFPSRELIAYHARSILADKALSVDWANINGVPILNTANFSFLSGVATSMDAKGLMGSIKVDDVSMAVSLDLTVAGTISANNLIGNGQGIRGVANYKKGNGFFSAGQTMITITDNFCTNETLVYLNIAGAITPLGVWDVNSSDGLITILSDRTEVGNVPFEYVMIKQN
jgi:hypothetical protein